MKVYHGSKRVIDRPIVNGSKLDNDYGPAFYLTKDLESAQEWACRNGTIGIVNVYDLNLKGLKVLDLTQKSVLNHLAILLHFRSLDSSFKDSFSYRLKKIEQYFYIDVSDYDVVIGYRADDAYFRFPLDFVRGNLTLEQLEYSYNLGELGIQYALMSEKAFKQLRFIESIESDGKYVSSYFNKVLSATTRFDNLNKDEDGKRINDILRELEK